MVAKIYTLGYEGLGLDEFLDILEQNQIRFLFDVRELPISRKPGFSKRALAEALEVRGISYEHWRKLGAPRDIRQALKRTGDWQAYERSYLELIDSRTEVLGRLAARAKQATICLLCFEKDYQECHRSLVTGKLERLHLIHDTKHLSPQRDQVAVAA